MKVAGLLLLLTAVACMATIGVSIRCFECSSKSECEAIDSNKTPPECNKAYVPESHQVRPEYDRCLRITDTGVTPMYKRICGDQLIEEYYRADCGAPDCAVLVCYSDKCLI
ncbi:hypothetical protein ACROYT_G035364 [Oculina patagonica]